MRPYPIAGVSAFAMEKKRRNLYEVPPFDKRLKSRTDLRALLPAEADGRKRQPRNRAERGWTGFLAQPRRSRRAHCVPVRTAVPCTFPGTSLPAVVPNEKIALVHRAAGSQTGECGRRTPRLPRGTDCAHRYSRSLIRWRWYKLRPAPPVQMINDVGVAQLALAQLVQVKHATRHRV